MTESSEVEKREGIVMSFPLKNDLYKVLCSIYSEERILENIETLKKLEAPRGYSSFKKSTAWCEDVLKKAGFSDVRRITHKADGETASYDFIMPQAWDLLGRSTLEIVEPFREMIADTDVSTMHVSEYAAPTPEGGVTAELVDYNTLDPEKPDCRGKFVFYRGYVPDTHPMYTTLAGAGCAGLVYAAFNTIEHAPDATSWNNGHGHIGWYHLKEDPVMPVFCVTPKMGIKLIELLSKGSVVLHGEMNTRLYDGEIYTVTATIPGKSEDEFAILAHMYEPFASDDSQGFGVGVEVGIMLKKLIDEGVLPQPEKTIRLIFSMERYGFGAFFANHDRKVLASLSIDTLTCLATEMLNQGIGFRESPVVCPFFGDMLFYELMKACCPEIKFNMSAGNMSDDCWQAEPTVDIPTNWLVSGCGYSRGDYHHCDAPIFDGVVPYLMAKLVPMVALYTSVIACSGREDFVKLSAELEKTAARWLEERKNFIAGRVATGRFKNNDAKWFKEQAEMLYLGRMASFNRFFDGVTDPKLPVHFADSFIDDQPERELTETEKKANSIRYRVISAGVPFSQARVPVGERVTWPAGYDLVWALLSPERSVLDAVRLRDAAFNASTSDEKIETYIAYFEFLEKYGYIERI